LAFSSDTQTPTPQSYFKVNFINSSSTTANKKFIWYYGDGTSFEGVNPQVHYYPSNGLYTVALKVVDETTMCIDSMSKKDYINCVGGSNCNQTINLTPTANNISGCLGGSVLIKVTTDAINPTFQWNNNGIPMGGETNSYYLATTNGNYSVTVYEQGGCPKTSPTKMITFNNPTPNVPIVTQSGNLLSCTPDTITLTASAGFGSYLWNTGSTSQSIQVHQSGVYAVMGKLSEGCNRQSDPVAVNASAVQAPPICMVTVDTAINKNLLIWEKPITTDIDSFVIFKETEPFVYTRIGSQPYNAISEFVDTSSQPVHEAVVYKLAAIDNCGNLTLPSIFHRTMHLQITPGIGYSRNLSWNNQLGFSYDSCIIYRGHYNSWTPVATISSQENTFIDYPNFNTLDTSYLVVVKVPNGGCSSTKVNSTAKIKSTSNSSSNKNLAVFADGLAEIKPSRLKIYPNPSSELIEISGFSANDNFIQIFDLTGQMVVSKKINFNEAKFQINISELLPGMYVIKVNSSNLKLVKN
jgi:hypothetical protein